MELRRAAGSRGARSTDQKLGGDGRATVASSMESMRVRPQNVMHTICPTPHFVSFAQAAPSRGADLTLVWRELAGMVAIGPVYYAIARGQFRRVTFGG